jgi:seryl-tRNA synthetase
MGDATDGNWLNLQREIEAKLTPLWVRRMTDALEAELVAERARREAAERRDRTLREQIAKEAQAQQELRRELDQALDEVSALKHRLDATEKANAALEARMSVVSQQLGQGEAQALPVQRESEELSTTTVEMPSLQSPGAADATTRIFDYSTHARVQGSMTEGSTSERNGSLTPAILWGGLLLLFVIGLLSLSWRR